MLEFSSKFLLKKTLKLIKTDKHNKKEKILFGNNTY